MKKMLLAQASACALALCVAACGGGGGGVNGPGSHPAPTPSPSPTPTPTPTPTPAPTTANADLVTLTKDESFTNDAALGTLTVPYDTGMGTASAAATTLTITYRAASHSYTVTDGNRTRTFTAADIDASQSSDAITTYVVTDGSTTDSLVLTKAGAGAGQTRYVASGYWQRTIEGDTSASGTVDAFTYGVETVDSALPRSGGASYGVMLLGVQGSGSSLSALGGAGVLNVDFGSGAIGGHGLYDVVDANSGSVSGDYSWTAYAALDSKHNSFAGVIHLDSLGDGGLAGRFYGPAAEEIGATWSAGGPDRAAVGTLQGAIGGYPLNQATNLSNPENDLLLPTLSRGFAATTADDDTIATIAGGTPIAAAYVWQDGDYVLYGADGTIVAPGQKTGVNVILGGGQGGDIWRAGLLTDTRNGAADVWAFVYGLTTADAAMPRSGSGYYGVALSAGLAHRGGTLNEITGNGYLVASFSGGDVTTSGGYVIYDRAPGDSVSADVADQGSWSGSGKIGAGNGFAGTLSLDGGTDYAGSMTGEFFGADASDVGAVFSLTNSGGDAVSGYFAGGADPLVAGAFDPLADLSGKTQMTAVAIGQRYRHASTGQNYDLAEYDAIYQGNAGGYDLYYDPTSSSARILITPLHYPDSTVVAAGDANYDAAASTAAMRVYSGEGAPEIGAEGNYELRDYIFDGQDGRIALTYTGFATLYVTSPVQKTDTYKLDEHDSHFFVYGNGTPMQFLPRTGKATYSGVVYGRGGVSTPEPNTDYYDLTGTSTLSADFGTDTMTARLAVTGTALDGGKTLDFGAYSFTGQIDGTNFGGPTETAGFYATTDDTTYSGAFMGTFFGPHAEEFGGVFDVKVTGKNGIDGYIRGGAVGKKD